MSLRVLPGGEERQPWHQAPNEDETEFSLFAGWLNSPRPRKPPDYPQIALAHDWTERADAFDQSREMPASPRGQLERMLADALVIGSLEMRKLMNRVRADGEPVLPVKEVMLFMHALVENKEALEKALAADDSAPDFSNMTDAELETILAAQSALAKVGKGAK